jgi:hypothetical protein
VQIGTTSLAKGLLSAGGSFYVNEGKQEHIDFFFEASMVTTIELIIC